MTGKLRVFKYFAEGQRITTWHLTCQRFERDQESARMGTRGENLATKRPDRERRQQHDRNSKGNRQPRRSSCSGGQVVGCADAALAGALQRRQGFDSA